MVVGMDHRPNIPYAVPKASSEPLPEIAEFLKPFAPLFRRSQSRHSLERYMTGLLTDLDRKNCDTIAAALAGTSTERLQHLLTDADWDSLRLDAARVRSLSAKSPKGGVLVLDDTSFPKQGKASVGVARQYCGALGKRANCQVAVSGEYVADEPESSRPLHWPVCARLYLPEEWADDEGRRDRAHVPEEVGFRSKPQIALSLADLSLEWGVPFDVVVADSGYGKYPTFLLRMRGGEHLRGAPARGGRGRQGGRSCAVSGQGTASQAAPRSPAYGRGSDRLPARRGVANGELEGGNEGLFEQANGGAASAPSDGKRSHEHRP
jgi:hypothetical protein